MNDVDPEADRYFEIIDSDESLGEEEKEDGQEDQQPKQRPRKRRARHILRPTEWPLRYHALVRAPYFCIERPGVERAPDFDHPYFDWPPLLHPETYT
jgi:hypothetical protein